LCGVHGINFAVVTNILGVHTRYDHTHVLFLHISDYYDRQQLFETKDYNATEMMFQVHLKGMQLDAEYEMAGKSVDDS
jgi:hypothetical protein